MKWAKQNGFTIVELLIVIVVIGILAAITIVSFNGVQSKARQAKINADVVTIVKAITAARIVNNSNTWTITQRYTEADCASKPNGTDLATLSKTADTCWTNYAASLNAISTVSGINIRGLVDPWGRPYYFNENEGEGNVSTFCAQDIVGTYSSPFVQWSSANTTAISYYNPAC